MALMEENVYSQDIQIITASIQKSLATVRKALGIQSASPSDDVNESTLEREVVSEIESKSTAEKFTAAELDEQKLYLAAMRDECQNMFSRNQAKFIDSRAKFTNQRRLKRDSRQFIDDYLSTFLTSSLEMSCFEEV